MFALNEKPVRGGSSCGLLADELVGGGLGKENKPVTIDGKRYKMMYGSRRQVYNGTAYKTKGNLKQADIKKNKQNRFVSVKKSLMATKEQRLLKYGYGARKGKFGYVRVKPQRSVKQKTVSAKPPLAGNMMDSRRRTRRIGRRRTGRRRTGRRRTGRR